MCIFLCKFSFQSSRNHTWFYLFNQLTLAFPGAGIKTRTHTSPFRIRFDTPALMRRDASRTSDVGSNEFWRLVRADRKAEVTSITILYVCYWKIQILEADGLQQQISPEQDGWAIMGTDSRLGNYFLNFIFNLQSFYFKTTLRCVENRKSLALVESH